MTPRLNTIDLMLVQDLFEKSGDRGYVLDFSNARMAEFFANELGVDIYADAYAKFGSSKFNRLKCYLQAVDQKVAANALTALWDSCPFACPRFALTPARQDRLRSGR